MENQDARKQLQDLITGLGSMAEMSHTFYAAMLKSGATKREAEVAMSAWISAYWHELAEASQRNKERRQYEEERE